MKYFILTIALLSCASPAAYAQPRGGGTTQVFVADVGERQIADKVEALGTLRANETVTLSSNVTDRVSAIRFEDGQRVAAGDVLIEMANAEETAALKEAQANVSEASRQVQRLRPLVDQGAASRSALDTQNRNLATARAQLDGVKSRLSDRIITAPFDGVVGLRNISVGALLQPGSIITTLDDDSVMKLDFTIPAVFLSVLREGLSIEARTRAYPERVFEGTVASIASQIDPATRAITVRALIPNNEKILKPGLLMTVTLAKNERTSVVIPELSLIVESDKHFVYLAQGDKAEKRQVTIGAREPGFVEIISGLSVGDVIVTDGVAKLVDGSAITVRAKRTGDESLSELLAKGRDAAAIAPAAEGSAAE